MRGWKAFLGITGSIIGVSGGGALLLIWSMDYFVENGDKMEYTSIFYLLGADLLIMIGGFVLIGAVFTWIMAKREGNDCTTPVRAVISGIRERQVRIGNSRQKSTIYMPDYTYTLNGEQRTTGSYQGSYDANRYVVGTEVELLVNPEDSSRCYAPADVKKKMRKLNTAWICLVAVGVLLLVWTILHG